MRLVKSQHPQASKIFEENSFSSDKNASKEIIEDSF